METWVFRRGRWRIISERWIITGVLFTSTLAGLAGFAAGLRLMESRYEGQIDTIRSESNVRVEAAEQEIAHIKQDVEVLRKASAAEKELAKRVAP